MLVTGLAIQWVRSQKAGAAQSQRGTTPAQIIRWRQQAPIQHNISIPNHANVCDAAHKAHAHLLLSGLSPSNNTLSNSKQHSQ